MEKKYYVNDRAQAGGEHEIHIEGCPYLSLVKNKTYLGDHPNCYSALVVAHQHYSKVDGCSTCSPNCHHQEVSTR